MAINGKDPKFNTKLAAFPHLSKISEVNATYATLNWEATYTILGKAGEEIGYRG